MTSSTLTTSVSVASEPESARPLPEPAGTPETVPRIVGVVGLGHMGTAFALNLIADGHRVLVYDRNPARLEALRQAGGEPAATFTTLAPCDVMLTSLPDDDALKAVALDGLIPLLRQGGVHVSMSTVSPGVARFLAGEHERQGQDYVAAPVLGNPDLAAARRLFVIAGGKAAAIPKVRGLLESLGQRLFVTGEDPGAANLIKLAGNVLTATTLQSMAEVLALLRKGGVDPRLAFEVLTNSLFDSKVHRTYGGKIVDERYSPAGMVAALALKDLRLALAEAEHEAVPMPAALRQTSIDALDTSGGTPAASDPNTRPQQRPRSTHTSLLTRLQGITGHRHCPRFEMGSTRTPSALASLRLSRLAKPPSAAACRGCLAVEGDVALEHGQEPFAVRRIAGPRTRMRGWLSRAQS